jgi:hypothetical protein
MKTCTRCKNAFEENDFYKNKKGKPYSICKKCWIAYTSEKRRGFNGRYSELKKDAKKRGIGFTLTKEDLRPLWGKECSYCGNVVHFMSLDRINNSKPYEISNIVVCCHWCNYTKGTSSLYFFYEQCKKVVENMPDKFKKIGNKTDCGDRYKTSYVEA